MNKNSSFSRFRHFLSDSSPFHHHAQSWGRCQTNLDLNLDHDDYQTLSDDHSTYEDPFNKTNGFTIYSRGRQYQSKSPGSFGCSFLSSAIFNQKTLTNYWLLIISIIVGLILFRSILLIIPHLPIQKLPNGSALEIPTIQLMNEHRRQIPEVDGISFLEKKFIADAPQLVDREVNRDALSENKDNGKNTVMINSHDRLNLVPADSNNLLHSNNSKNFPNSSNFLMIEKRNDTSILDEETNPISIIESNDNDENDLAIDQLINIGDNKRLQIMNYINNNDHKQIFKVMNELNSVKISRNPISMNRTHSKKSMKSAENSKQQSHSSSSS